MIYLQHFSSAMGKIVMASDGTNLIGLWFNKQKYFAETLTELPVEQPLPVFDQTVQWLKLYFQGERPDFLPPISVSGSPFRLKVWNFLAQIPYGTLTTYGKIAKKIASEPNGKNVSAQAVGGAVAHNPVSILIPCHRVIGSNGNLTGYAGGIEKKLELLKLEGIDTSKLSLPKKFFQ